MKIPSKIKIGGLTYQIQITDDLKLGSDLHDAEIDYSEGKIRLTTRLENYKELKERCLIHEIIHGVLFYLDNKEINDNEQMVELITSVVYMIIKDNPELFNYLR